MASDYTPLFAPRSIAVVGASENPHSVGRAILNNLVEGGYPGELYVVHPTLSHVLGVPAVPSVARLASAPELAVLAVAASHSGPVLDALLRGGTRAVMSVASTLPPPLPDSSATGPGGYWLARFRETGARVLGPNCMGLHAVREEFRLDASFSRVRPRPGPAAVFTHSGSIGEWLLMEADRRGAGVSAYASLGNRVDVDVPDLLSALPGLFPEIDRVVLYLEALGRVEELLAAAADLPESMRLFALLGGTSDAGRRAALAHTGALAPARAEDALDRAGVELLTGLGEAVEVLAAPPFTPAAGRRVGVVTNAGGPAILAVDRLRAFGLELPSWSSHLVANLRLSPEASAGNPVDLLATAGAEDYHRVLRKLVRSGEVDALLVIFMAPVFSDEPAVIQSVSEVLDETPIPSVFCHMGGASASTQAAPRDPQAAASLLARLLSRPHRRR